jgi:hypothetical protein
VPTPQVTVVYYGGYVAVAPGYYANNSYGSYLSGRADLVTARANAAVTYQQAGLVQQDVMRSQLQTRQAILQESQYERGIMYNSQQMREIQQNDALRRARNDPPLNEIWAGISLNSLYGDIKKAHSYGVRGPAVPLDQEMLKHINLTTGVTSAGLGILKDGANFRWPTVLRDQRFDDGRKKLETMTAQALAQAAKGPVDLDLVSQMRDTVDGMQTGLKQVVKDVSPSAYMDGKRFLRELDASYVTLKEPNVSNYFNAKWAPQGATVYDLTDYMLKNGLQFAPAVSGDQSSYTALYRAMSTYDLQMSQAVSR